MDFIFITKQFSQNLHCVIHKNQYPTNKKHQIFKKLQSFKQFLVINI